MIALPTENVLIVEFDRHELRMIQLIQRQLGVGKLRADRFMIRPCRLDIIVCMLILDQCAANGGGNARFRQRVCHAAEAALFLAQLRDIHQHLICCHLKALHRVGGVEDIQAMLHRPDLCLDLRKPGLRFRVVV